MKIKVECHRHVTIKAAKTWSVFAALTATALTAACASTPRQKIIQNMFIAGALGVAAGQQKEESKANYSAMYAGAAASLAALGSLYYYDIDDENKKLREETAQLKSKLDNVFSPSLEKSLPGTMSGKIPEKYRALVSPGEWRVYAIDQWIDDGDNRLLHQDKIMELIPPTLKPATLPSQKK